MFEENFGTSAVHSPKPLETCLFLNHISILMAYRGYVSLRHHDEFSRYVVVKTLRKLLWDFRVRNAGTGWENLGGALYS